MPGKMRVRRKKRHVKDVSKSGGGYDTSYRATGVRPESKTEQNARFNKTRRKGR